MLFAQGITQFSYVIIGAFTVIIFLMFDVIGGTKNNVIVNMSFVNMGGYYIGIFTL